MRRPEKSFAQILPNTKSNALSPQLRGSHERKIDLLGDKEGMGDTGAGFSFTTPSLDPENHSFLPRGWPALQPAFRDVRCPFLRAPGDYV